MNMSVIATAEPYALIYSNVTSIAFVPYQLIIYSKCYFFHKKTWLEITFYLNTWPEAYPHVRANVFEKKKLKYERRKLQESYKTGNEVNLISTAACLLIASLRKVL